MISLKGFTKGELLKVEKLLLELLKDNGIIDGYTIDGAIGFQTDCKMLILEIRKQLDN